MNHTKQSMIFRGISRRSVRLAGLVLAPVAGLLVAAICQGDEGSGAVTAPLSTLPTTQPAVLPTTVPTTLPSALSTTLPRVTEAGSAESHAAMAALLAGSTNPTTNPSTLPSTNPTTASALVSTTNPATTTASVTTRPAVAVAGGYSSSGRDRSGRDRYSSGRSSKPPETTQPKLNAPTPSKPMPSQYAILEQRSLFSHVKPKMPREGGDLPPPPPPPPTQPAGTDVAPLPPEPIHPELAFAVRGLAEEDHVPIGLIEDGNTGRTFQVHVGDLVCRGRIAAMTLSTLDYSMSGKVTQVHLGDNFEGQPAAFSTTRPSVPTVAGTTPAPSGTAPTPPVAGAAPPASPDGPPGGGSSAALIEKLRLKRLAELGGGK